MAINMMSEAEQIEYYNRTGNTPTAWIVAADSLQAAARILKGHRDRFDPMQLSVGDNVPDEGKVLFPELMLKGFAVECLMKALWLKRGNKLVVNGKYVGIKGAADHNLLQIADALGLCFKGRERDVLKQLSSIMTSVGRYPIPRDWSDRKIQKIHGGGKGMPGYWRYPSDDEILEDVIVTLEQELNGVQNH